MMRVHELAKELGIASKDLLKKLHDRRIEAKNHMTSLDEDVVKLFLEERAASRGGGVVLKRDSALLRSAGSQTAKERRFETKKEDVPAAAREIPAPQAASSVRAADIPAAKHEAAVMEAGAPAAKGLKPLEVPVPISVKDLAEKLAIKSSDLIKHLMTKFRLFANINQGLTEEIAADILRDYGFELMKPPALEETAAGTSGVAAGVPLKARSPIVTFMGHVDHGKTSLLDAIRRTKVAESEHGGITQHIGAYEVKLPKGKITFLDTPGHEAFTSMRARGAMVTDIVVLVVAADDGVMPQTVEAIDHAKAAKVPIVVAMNKMDKPQADPERLKRQLSELGLTAEDWGGKTIFVGVSAKSGDGIENLLAMILLEAEMLELKSPYECEASGVVVEAKLSKGRGPVASVLVQRGTLKAGDFLIAGYHSGRVRAMLNERRQGLEQAGPSTPVEIIGLSGVPSAGEKFYVVADEKKARDIMERKQEEFRRRRLEPATKRVHVHLEDLYQHIKEGSLKELNIILKADVQGSLEAIEDALAKVGSQEVKLKTMHKGVGLINTSDVVLATASNAIVIGFHVEPDEMAREMAQKEDIDIRTYRVIYEIVNDMKAALEGLLSPKIKKVFLGRVEVRKVFKLTKAGSVAGSFVKKGRITRGAQIVLLRNGEAVHEGKVAALKRFKDDVREVQEGFECGVSLQNFEDIREGDVIDAYELEQVARKLE